jgi:hypothetical protein
VPDVDGHREKWNPEVKEGHSQHHRVLPSRHGEYHGLVRNDEVVLLDATLHSASHCCKIHESEPFDRRHPARVSSFGFRVIANGPDGYDDHAPRIAAMAYAPSRQSLSVTELTSRDR